MKIRTASVTLTAALLMVVTTGCDGGGGAPLGEGVPRKPDAAASPGRPDVSAKPPSPVSQSPMTEPELRKRLLTAGELGPGYVALPTDPKGERKDHDTSMTGCPALEKLAPDGKAGSFKFAAEVEAEFSYGTGDSELTEELSSDAPAKLSSSTKAIFDGFASCGAVTVTTGSQVVQVRVEKQVPPPLGDEQYAHTMSFETGAAGGMVLKQTSVRVGNVMVMLAGSPGLVDANLERAVAKARAAR